MASRVGGIDYKAKRVDVAVVDGRRLIGAKSFTLAGDVGSVVAGVVEAVTLVKQAGARELWLEAPWFRGADLKTGARASSGAAALELHKTATRIETVAVLMRLTVNYVHVGTWHKHILGNGAIRSAEAKQASIRFAMGAYGWDTKGDDNEADAICLAAYGEAMQRFKGLLPQTMSQE